MGHSPHISLRQRGTGWLQLFRVPNQFTVPGDPLAGMAVAALVSGTMPSAAHLLWPVAAALCLYAFGLVVNDLADYPQDRLNRPQRPLPRRYVGFFGATLAALLLGGAGLACAWVRGQHCLALALCLLFFICLYDILVKEWGWLGCLVMGLCRGNSFLLGVDPADWSAPLVAMAGAVTLYITLVTRASKREDGEWRHGWRACRPAAVMAVACLGVCLLAGGYGRPWSAYVPVAVAALVASVFAFRTGLGLARGVADPARTQAAIGAYIRGLIPFQAACLFLLPLQPWWALAILAGWPVAMLLGRWFYGS